jgi:type I restriction enzyme R subunit
MAQRREQALAYEKYMKRLQEFAKHVVQPETSGDYPSDLRTPAQRALYDNLGQDADLALKIDAAIQIAREDSWRGNVIKERKIKRAIAQALENRSIPESILAEIPPEYRSDQEQRLIRAVDHIFDIVIEQHEY